MVKNFHFKLEKTEIQSFKPVNAKFLLYSHSWEDDLYVCKPTSFLTNRSPKNAGLYTLSSNDGLGSSKRASMMACAGFIH